MTRFIDDALNAVDLEYDARNEEYEKSISREIDERVEEGVCIDNVFANFDADIVPKEMVEDSDKEIAVYTKVKVSFPENQSKFRKGDFVNLCGHGTKSKLSIEIIDSYSAVLSSESRKNPMFFRSIDIDLIKSDGWTIEERQLDLRDRIKVGLRSINENLSLINILSRTDFELSDRSKSKNNGYYPPNLDSSQAEAFSLACSANNPTSIFGPPGTGKTFLLAHIIKYHLQAGERILITAKTHAAINNLLLMAANFIPTKKLYKVGLENNRPNSKKYAITNIESSPQFEIPNTEVVVGATCFEINKSFLGSNKFDLLIIDEASQLNSTMGLSAMSYANKFILCGDPNQLGPIFPSSIEPNNFNCSIMDLLTKKCVSLGLKTTYRMNTDILSFPNSEYYQNDLESSAEAKHRCLTVYSSEEKSNTPAKIISGSNKENWTVVHEAHIVASIISQYLEMGVSPEDIGVIAPFRKHVNLISEHVRGLQVEATKSLKIDTVERFQGQERNLIIFSTGIASEFHCKSKLDFILDSKRFNVAITRAKMKRIVLAHPVLLEMSSPADLSSNQYLAVFQRFISKNKVVLV